MIRAARPGDDPGLAAFLAQHANTTMFMRAGLARFGLSDRVHPHGARFWIETAGRQAGRKFAPQEDEIRGAFSLSNAGFLGGCGGGALFWQGVYDAMQGRQIAGLTGAADVVEGMLRTLELQDAAFDLNRTEPLYRLDLDRLIPPGPAVIRKPGPADAPLLTTWFRAYHIEALGATDDDALTETVAGRVANTISGGHVRLLIENGRPAAMTTFNAQLPDMVQIGGVYTPPEARGRGLARRGVAAHLKEARHEGVTAAVLFASGAACRAYEAIGFERVGNYRLAILSRPVTIGNRA